MANFPINWDLSDLYSGLDDPRIQEDNKAFLDAHIQFAEKWQANSAYLEDAEILKEALDDLEKLNFEHAELKSAYFVYLKLQLDLSNAELKGLLEKYLDIEKEAMNRVRFFQISLGKIAEPKQTEFLQDEGLKVYKHFLERAFSRAKYLLSDGEERVALEYSTAVQAWGRMRETLLNGEEFEFESKDKGLVKIGYGQVMDYFQSQDKEERDRAAKLIQEFCAKYAPILEHELNGVLSAKKASDKLRGYEFPAQARHVSDDMPSSVVEALQVAVTEGFDISREFYKLKAKLLKQEKLGYHERSVPVILPNSDQEKFEYAKALELTYETFNDLDPEFGEVVLDFAKNGRIDVFPQVNRRDGAFCIDAGKNLPSYVLLTHADKLRNVLTLAHELGHAANNALMAKTQNSLNYGSPLSTAEVASTFMEDFVFQKLLKTATPERKFELLMAKLTDEISTIMRQVACYNFEVELHDAFREKGYLSKEQIGELFKKHMSAYMGDFVSQDPGSENWWIYWSHIRTFFYNYTYASGLIISKSLQAKVKEDPAFISEVKKFFAAGTSNSPVGIFLDIGIDISNKDFWANGIAEVRANLEEAQKLAKELGLV